MYDQPTTTEIDLSEAGFRSTRSSRGAGCSSTVRSTEVRLGGPLTCRHRRPRHRGRRRPQGQDIRPRQRDPLARFRGGQGDWVRVNGFGTPWWADDLAALSQVPVGGVMLAMVESPDHVTETATRLPNVPIVALVETARGLERISEIASSKNTFRLAFGIGDFRRDTGFGGDPLTLAYARSRFTIAAKAAHLPSAIDGPTVGSSTHKLSEATAVSVEFGMTGKICLTPDQCHPVNEGLSPQQEEISWAREFFSEFERDGGEIRNGSDLPRIARATKILELACSYGITTSDFDDDEPGHPPAPSDTYHH